VIVNASVIAVRPKCRGFGTRFADYITGQWQNHCKYKKGR